MMMLERLYYTCLDNDFDDVELNGDVLNCGIRCFDRRYRLEAVERDVGVELALSDCVPLAATPEVLAFFERHGEHGYPLRRTVASPAKLQDALNDLQSAADDLFGFGHDLAEERHTPESADAALECNFALRDTPLEHAMLDSPAAGEMRAHRAFWRLSAGSDLRDLVTYGFDSFIGLFVHTGGSPDFDLDAPGMVYEDAHNRVTLFSDREFDWLTVPPTVRGENPDSGRVLLYRGEIVSKRFGSIEKPLICAVCDDAWFAAEFLVPNRIAVETVCRLRGGVDAWLTRALKPLRTRRFISAAPPEMGTDDDILQKYPQLAGVPAALVPKKSRSALKYATVHEVR